MADEKPLKFSKDDQSTLQHLSDLLHLFHHRNKNQHRRSIWWRHFSIFRRQMNLLLKDVISLNEVPQTHLERTRKKTRDKQTQTRVRKRLDFWQNVLVSKCQSSFSQIVADGRFAAFGLVLTAVLAQVCQTTGITSVLDDLGQIEMEEVIKKFGEADCEGELEAGFEQERRREDIGVAILRDSENLGDEKDESVALAITEGDSKSKSKRKTPASDPRTKKRRKKGNAIDDLFSGLD